MNNSITEDYCSFEVSNKIWRKGGRLNSDKCFTYSESHPNGAGWYEDLKGELSIKRPTHALALKWIRENFGVHISISPVFEFNDGRDDYLMLQGWQYWITVITGGKYTEELSKAAFKTENSPEEATEAAILYTLNNLI